jgi:hypothetical protein
VSYVCVHCIAPLIIKFLLIPLFADLIESNVSFIDPCSCCSFNMCTAYTDWTRDRIPVGARFFAHIQTGPGAHPASCTMGTGSFPGVKQPGCDADTHPLLAPRSRMSRAIPLFPSGFLVACYGVTFTFIYRLNCNFCF